MKHIALAIALTAPGLAFAQSCPPSTSADLPVFEAAKAAFLKTDYKAFANLVDDYIPTIDDQFEALFGPLDALGPRGFDRCRTVLQRRETPGFAQELILFFPKGSTVPLALHLVGVEADGEVRMLEFTYNTAISEVLEGLH
ncbi:hypothetical protein [Yoonia sp. SS1-5]|uniref:DUF3887 domain-containing protein n=1 Tax=Yoonia rhodophyticola TaxID=3137370 RepID=A0AAN0M9S6_9RHOB